MFVSSFWTNVIVVLIFILIGGVFAAAELALVSLREGQITRLAKRGRRGRALAALVERIRRASGDRVVTPSATVRP